MPACRSTCDPCLICTVPQLQFKAVKPVGDRVLVKVDKEEQKSGGGVLLPTAAQSRPTAGSVVSAGDVNMVEVRLGNNCSIGASAAAHSTAAAAPPPFWAGVSRNMHFECSCWIAHRANCKHTHSVHAADLQLANGHHRQLLQ